MDIAHNIPILRIESLKFNRKSASLTLKTCQSNIQTSFLDKYKTQMKDRSLNNNIQRQMSSSFPETNNAEEHCIAKFFISLFPSLIKAC